MNKIQKFENTEFGSVRTMTDKNNNVWFVAKDICDSLGYTNSRKAISDHVDTDDKGVTKCDTLGGTQDLTIINESGVYALVFGSKLPSAKKFKKWVTSEILPTIRKHGAYMTAETLEKALYNPDFLIRLANELKDTQEHVKHLETKIDNDKPKVVFADAVATSKTSILVADLAKIIKQNGYDIGQKRLFEWMRNNGYLIKKQGSDYNSPTQYAMNLGLFKIKETAITHSSGTVTVNKTTKVTGKGQQYFINKFMELKNEENS